MKVTEVKFTRRFNLGDYEHEEYGLSGIIEGKESSLEALTELKAQVLAAFTAKAIEASETKPKKGTKNGKAKASDTDNEDDDAETSAGSDDSGNDDEGNQDDEAPEDAAGSDDNDSTDDDDESDKKPAKGKKVEKSAKGKTGKTKKPQAYDREVEQHKEIFSGVLKSVAPDWKKNEASKARAKSVSQKMEGKDFLDAEGDVLPEFEAQVKKLMSSKK